MMQLKAALKDCNSISVLRKAGELFKEDILESLKPTVLCFQT